MGGPGEETVWVDDDRPDGVPPATTAEAGARGRDQVVPAAVAFVVAIVVAAPVIGYLNRDQWFFLDEWDFLTTRSLSPESLLEPHNEHLSTLPIVAYRLLFRTVGLHHYWPYQALAIGAHLVAAVLLRAVMRRAGVGPWLATVAAIAFAYFGPGRENMAWGFQVGMSGALAFGLAHLLLADHDGPFDRRDALGLACGVAALLCSGIGVTMAVAVGASTLLTRGWRIAAAHVVPLGIGYLVWTLAYGQGRDEDLASTVRELATFVANVVADTFAGLAPGPWTGILLGAALVAGTVLVVQRVRRQPADLAVLGPTAGLLVGAVAFVCIAAYGRAGLSTDSASRYVHIAAALVLPALALSLQELGRRWRPLTLVGVALLVVALPGNIDALEPTGGAVYTKGAPDQVLQVAAAPVPPGIPDSVEPFGFAAPGVTVGWLRSANAAGRIPPPPEGSAQYAPRARLAVSVEQVAIGGQDCRRLALGRPVEVRRGEILRIPADVAILAPSQDPAGGLNFSATSRPAVPPAADGGPQVRIRVWADTLDLIVQNTRPGAVALRCTAPAGS